MTQREKEIHQVLTSVADASAVNYYNSHGPDESRCPFCYESCYEADADMDEIDHDPNCIYLIAKDLLTGIE